MPASIRTGFSVILQRGPVKRFRIHYLEENERKCNRFWSVGFVRGILAPSAFIPIYTYREVERSSIQSDPYRNLLAMNASIRAAHVRTAGRDFAVVTGEIRSPAARPCSSRTRAPNGSSASWNRS